VNLERLYQKYKDKAQFYFVYASEAHVGMPVRVKVNGEEQDQLFPETSSLPERRRRAKLLRRTTNFTLPALVANDAMETAYGGWPARVVVITPQGRVAYTNNHTQLDRSQKWIRSYIEHARSTPLAQLGTGRALESRLQ
jgi:hypothetical protein